MEVMTNTKLILTAFIAFVMIAMAASLLNIVPSRSQKTYIYGLMMDHIVRRTCVASA
jgi:hypothetical protein